MRESKAIAEPSGDERGFPGESEQQQSDFHWTVHDGRGAGDNYLSDVGI